MNLRKGLLLHLLLSLGRGGPKAFGDSASRGHWGCFWPQIDARGEEALDSPQPTQPLQVPARSQRSAVGWECGGGFKPHWVPPKCRSNPGVSKESMEEARRGAETGGDFQTGLHLSWTNTKAKTGQDSKHLSGCLHRQRPPGQGEHPPSRPQQLGGGD